jgi:hypothetical protein
MPPPYTTPQDAVDGLIEAYRTLDVDEIVRNKDFDIDSRIFWQGLGLPVSPQQLAESRAAFETNFRNEMKEGIPDYRAVTFRVTSEERPQANFAVVTLAGLTTDGRTRRFRIPVLQTDNGWKVVLHSAYDRL